MLGFTLRVLECELESGLFLFNIDKLRLLFLLNTFFNFNG